MNWITILKSKNSFDADLLVNALGNLGISAITMNKQVAGYPIIGFIEVMVLEEFKNQAEEFLAVEVQKT